MRVCPFFVSRRGFRLHRVLTGGEGGEGSLCTLHTGLKGRRRELGNFSFIDLSVKPLWVANMTKNIFKNLNLINFILFLMKGVYFFNIIKSEVNCQNKLPSNNLLTCL